MSFIRASGLGPLTASNTATIVDPATPASGSATLGPIVSFASQTASGTTVSFTGIPSWAKRVTVVAHALSTNGSSPIIIQLGSSGGYTTSGYSGSVQYGSSVQYTSSTTMAGFYSASSATAGSSYYFIMQIYLADPAAYKWVTSGASGDSSGSGGSLCSYYGLGVTLSGVLTQIRLNTVNGTDTFDAGAVTVYYE